MTPVNQSHVDQFLVNQNGILIHDGCYESDPCEHLVKIDDGNQIFLDAGSIVFLLTERQIAIPSHFAYACEASTDADAGLDLFD